MDTVVPQWDLPGINLPTTSTAMNLTLTPPEVFSAFPYNPYPMQTDLMRHLYKSIEHKKVSIVESPTGTVSHFSVSDTSVALIDVHTSAGQDSESPMCMSYLAVRREGPCTEWEADRTSFRQRSVLFES